MILSRDRTGTNDWARNVYSFACERRRLGAADENEYMTELFAMWMESDIAVRRAAIEAHFQRDVRFHDRDGEFVGYDGLEKFSDSLQTRFPGAKFTLAGQPQRLGDAIRAYWHFGPPANPAAVSGMDFIILSDGRASALYAFVDIAS
jgi:SnoaL-like domain